DHVEELGDLVELPLLEESSDRGIDLIVFLQQPGADLLLRPDAERAELVNREDALVLSDPLAAVEDGPAARGLDGERNAQEHGRQQDQRAETHEGLQEARRQVLATRERQRGGVPASGVTAESDAHAGGVPTRGAPSSAAAGPYSSCHSAKIRRPHRLRL